MLDKDGARLPLLRREYNVFGSDCLTLLTNRDDARDAIIVVGSVEHVSSVNPVLIEAGIAIEVIL
jgi:hypothetical protein